MFLEILMIKQSSILMMYVPVQFGKTNDLISLDFMLLFAKHICSPAAQPSDWKGIVM